MRTILRRLTCLAVVVLLFAGGAVCAMSAPATNLQREIYHNDDFIYEVMSDDTISIHFYMGSNDVVIIPTCIDSKPVTVIESLAFYETDVKSVVISEGITTIGEQAFYCANSLEKVHIPSTVSTVGKNAFHSCTALKSVVFAQKAKNALGEYMFTGCTNLSKVSLPENLTSIPVAAFAYCQNLSSLTLSAELKAIGDFAFYESGISTLSLPQSITSIGEGAFAYTQIEELFAPSRLVSIGENAFAFCKELRRILISGNKVQIGDRAFEFCAELDDINITGYDAQIGEGAFAGCKVVYPPSESINPDPTEPDYIEPSYPSSGDFAPSSPIYADPTEAPTTEPGYFEPPYEEPTYADPTEAPTTESPYDEATSDELEPPYDEISSAPSTEAPAISYDVIYVDEDFFESDHDYMPNSDITWIVERENAEYINLVFSAESRLENNYDFIYIYDGNDNIIDIFTDDYIAEFVVRVESSVAKVRLISDESIEYYGFHCKIEACIRPDDYLTEDNFYVGTPEAFRVNEESAIFTAKEIAANNKKELLELAWNVRTRGDVNNDNSVNIKDATAIQKYVAGIIKESEGFVYKNADVNADGKVNIKDATAVQKFIAGLGTA